MGFLAGFIGASIFLIGLFQWAQGGANLWRIFRIKREEKNLTREEKRAAEDEIKQLERAADRTIGASFRIIAFLAVLVWIFFGVTMLLELFGINWTSTFATHAKTYWSRPNVDSQIGNVQSRNDMLRNMGNSLRR
ncbi:MAG: hypothetical protein IKN30_01485 [Synergistaceae bacterium]|nr:hypothetical protein [Synergistaceae bacterium]